MPAIQLRENRLLLVPLARDASLAPSYVHTKPESPTKIPRLPVELNAMNRMFFPVGVNPAVGTVLNDVPLYKRTTPFPPAASAYDPPGFQASAKSGCPVPEERSVIFPGTAYIKAVPESPTMSAEFPFGFQLIE